MLVVGGGSGIGREVALLLAERGAHVVVADLNARECRGRAGRGRGKLSSPEMGMAARPRSLVARDASRRRCAPPFWQFGGVDIVINTAAIYPTPDPSAADAESVWDSTLRLNVTA